MLKGAFEELTVERGETINILGMTVHMDREKKRAIINQKLSWTILLLLMELRKRRLHRLLET